VDLVIFLSIKFGKKLDLSQLLRSICLKMSKLFHFCLAPVFLPWLERVSLRMHMLKFHNEKCDDSKKQNFAESEIQHPFTEMNEISTKGTVTQNLLISGLIQIIKIQLRMI
jgi:hypothetical protein